MVLREKMELSTQACNTESSLKTFVFVYVYLKGAAYVQVTDFPARGVLGASNNASRLITQVQCHW